MPCYPEGTSLICKGKMKGKRIDSAWGSPAMPLLPKSLRETWGDEALPKWFAAELKLSPELTAVALGPTWASSSAGELTDRHRNFLLNLVNARRWDIGPVRVFAEPVPYWLDLYDLPFSTRTRNCLVNGNLLGAQERLATLTFADLFKIQSMGAVSILEFACTLEAALGRSAASIVAPKLMENQLLNVGANVLPGHLQPWAELLGVTWPPTAGTMPDERAVSMALRWVKPGEVSGLAIAMYCRPEGASKAEVLAACHDKKTNRARALHLERKLDFMKAWMPDGTLRYFIGLAGSRPGPVDAKPFVNLLEDRPETDEDGNGGKMTEIPKQLLEIATKLCAGDVTNRYKVRALLGWFGVTRRGAKITSDIRAALASLDLETQPDFEEADIDDPLRFVLVAENSRTTDDNMGSNPRAATTDPSDEAPPPSDDFLEPEIEEEQVERPDDRPVISQTRDWTISVLRERWEAGELELRPKFQREYVWTLRPELPSRLIESLLLEIPIPPIYFGKDVNGQLEMIDGQQRLTTLIDFVSNKFPLRRLNRMASLNHKYFRELSAPMQRKIQDTPIRSITIDVGTNSDLRYEVFERLNRGSMALNEQELRNCVYRGPFNDLLAELERDQSWRRVKGGDVPEPRFKEREIILRFFAFVDRLQYYAGNLKKFLNEYMGQYAPDQLDALRTHEAAFKQTMQNIYAVFGANSARLYEINHRTNTGGWDTKFSVTAFDIQASALWSQPTTSVQRVAEQIRELFLFTLLTDVELQMSTTRATGSAPATKMRWTKFRLLAEPIITGTSNEPRFFPFDFRKRLYETSKTCQLCGNEIHSLEDSTVDHIIPYSEGGKTIPNNGQLTHRACNASKNARTSNLIGAAPREVDAAMEQLELKLRTLIDTTLAQNISRVPSHVLQKVNERIEKAIKKNAAFNSDRYKSLIGKLEYFDLRELQDTITSQGSWPQFEPRFTNKETLNVKFDQLAELRNGIRHSRTISEEVRKEGEAAILWFNKVLAK